MALINKRDKADVAMIDALGSSGTVEAHRALVAILKARKLDPVRLKVAAIALSRTQHPTRESVEGLQALLDVPGLRIQAMYGLGTSIRQLRAAGEEAEAERLLPIIVDRLRRYARRRRDRSPRCARSPTRATKGVRRGRAVLRQQTTAPCGRRRWRPCS